MARNRERGGTEPTPDITEPTRSPEPVEPADAYANVQAVFGADVKWERTFLHVPGEPTEDGQPTTDYVDQATGQLFKGAMPQLHPSDGIPVELPRKR